MPFREAANEMAFLKAGFFGFQGSGKSWTAALVAIGLHKYIGSKKPICFIDTETGSSFLLPQFQKAKIQLLVSNTRAFSQLLVDVDEAEKTADILVVDSITHFWRELLKAWKRKRQRTFISIQDFGPLKEEWQQYSDRYVNSKLHIIMCGRASNIFQDVEDEDATEDAGSKKFKAVKVGTKMSAEGEMGFEPSLLIEMEKVFTQDGGRYVHRAKVIKERFGVIDSEEYDNPTFKDFLPHIKLLNIGGAHVGVDTTQSSESMFESADKSRYKDRTDREILLEEIEGQLTSAFPGRSTAEIKAKADIMEVGVGTGSWTAIKGYHADKLRLCKMSVGYLCRAVISGQDVPAGVEFLPWLKDALKDMGDSQEQPLI